MIKVFFGIIFIIFTTLSFEAKAQLVVTDPGQTALLLANLPGELAALQAAVTQLKNFNWNSDDAQSQLQNLYGYLQRSGNLASDANSVASEFQKNFPGYNPTQNYQSQYQSIMTDTNQALQSVMQVMASINSQPDSLNQNQNLARIQTQIQGAKGTLQATQGLAQITAQLASNLQVLQKTVSAQASAQDAYYVSQMQNEESNQAGMKQLMDNGAKSAPPIGHSGESVHFEDNN